MTITQKDHDVLYSPVEVPTVSADLINNFEGELDKNVLDIFKAIVRDIDDFKQSIHGIRRRYDDMLFLFNRPTQKETDVIEAARMNKYGYFAIGTEYPRWDRARVDVNGSVYAIPQYGLWAQTVNLAGGGLYTWDTEVFNPNTDIYSRATANTQIRIDEPGSYDIRTNVYATDAVSATGAPITWVIRRNTVNIVQFSNSLFTDDTTMQNASKIIDVVRGDLIDVELNTPATANRAGSGTIQSFLEICKVN